MIMNTTSSYTIFDGVACIFWILLLYDDFIRWVTCTRVTIGYLRATVGHLRFGKGLFG